MGIETVAVEELAEPPICDSRAEKLSLPVKSPTSDSSIDHVPVDRLTKPSNIENFDSVAARAHVLTADQVVESLQTDVVYG